MPAEPTPQQGKGAAGNDHVAAAHRAAQTRGAAAHEQHARVGEVIGDEGGRGCQFGGVARREDLGRAAAASGALGGEFGRIVGRGRGGGGEGGREKLSVGQRGLVGKRRAEDGLEEVPGVASADGEEREGGVVGDRGAGGEGRERGGQGAGGLPENGENSVRDRRVA